jgi:hypothetical protein
MLRSADDKELKDQVIQIKLSADGARMSRTTKFRVPLPFSKIMIVLCRA